MSFLFKRPENITIYHLENDIVHLKVNYKRRGIILWIALLVIFYGIASIYKNHQLSIKLGVEILILTICIFALLENFLLKRDIFIEKENIIIMDKFFKNKKSVLRKEKVKRIWVEQDDYSSFGFRFGNVGRIIPLLIDYKIVTAYDGKTLTFCGGLSEEQATSIARLFKT